MTELHPRTPVLVGCGEITDTDTPPSAGRSPYDLIADAARRALADAGAPGLGAAIDTLAMLRSFADTSHRFASPFGGSSNPPASIARRLGIAPARLAYTWNGGNMPQYLVNAYAERIAAGEMRAALIVGGEALRTQHAAERAGLPVDWREDPGGEPELVGDPRRGWNDHEDAHGLRAAIVFYPLIEHAIRAARGTDMATHMASMARLFAGFAKVAAANPLATRREGYDAERIGRVDDDNRWIGHPDPKLMNANAYIDQAAALAMTSVGVARELGIPESRWVFLHGCADGHDHWYLSERPELHRSPAIREVSREAFAMAGRGIADMHRLDLYSCFPSAVEIGCAEIGIAEDDPRGLTLTGGLPYFGGPGNNYVTHSIAAMMRAMRAEPGRFGLVTANGNYVTKHSFGVYSTEPVRGPWRRGDPAALQARLDALPKDVLDEHPDGAARIETYTVMHDRGRPVEGIVFGRLDASGARFIARLPDDPAVLAEVRDTESLGRPGRVGRDGGINRFVPTPR
jgi:acetyl-CoA C-acetyltransferase